VAAAVAGDPRDHGLLGLFHNVGFSGSGMHGSSVGWEKTRQIQAAKNRRKKLLRPLRESERVGTVKTPLSQSFSF
jgi:hypothetical protein